MKKTLIIYCLIAGFAMSASARVPGYLGRRFSIQYQFGISPQWNDLNSSVPYMFHTAQIGYVVSRQHELGFQYTRTDYNNTSTALDVSQNGESESLGTVNSRKFGGNNLMFFVKFFRPKHGFIAPLGSFVQLGIGYQYYSELMHVSPSSSNSTFTNPHYYNVTSHDFYFGVGFGRNFIVADRLILNLQMDINLPLSALIRMATTSQDGSSTGEISYVQQSLKRTNATDVVLVNIVHFKFGIGGLLF